MDQPGRYGALRLGPRDVGSRVVVRYRRDALAPPAGEVPADLDEAPLSDVLGDLLRFDEGSADDAHLRVVVQPATGPLVDLPRAAVLAGKVVPPRRTSRPPADG